jgi:hypothetical protein
VRSISAVDGNRQVKSISAVDGNRQVRSISAVDGKRQVKSISAVDGKRQLSSISDIDGKCHGGKQPTDKDFIDYQTNTIIFPCKLSFTSQESDILHAHHTRIQKNYFIH